MEISLRHFTRPVTTNMLSSAADQGSSELKMAGVAESLRNLAGKKNLRG